jgi:predicted enzyme related to lactoylglutathione lyase
VPKGYAGVPWPETPQPKRQKPVPPPDARVADVVWDIDAARFKNLYLQLLTGPIRKPADASDNRKIETKESAMFLGLRTAKYEVQDLAKAKEWYGKVLGIQPYFDQPFYVGYNVGGYELGLTPEPAAGSKRSAAGVAYWGVKDARAAYKRLLDLGATGVEEVQDVGGGILVGEVRDPFGNVLGVIDNPHFKAGETK